MENILKSVIFLGRKKEPKKNSTKKRMEKNASVICDVNNKENNNKAKRYCNQFQNFVLVNGYFFQKFFAFNGCIPFFLCVIVISRRKKNCKLLPQLGSHTRTLNRRRVSVLRKIFRWRKNHRWKILEIIPLQRAKMAQYKRIE